ARMGAIPRVVATARATIGRPPRVKVETAIRQTKGAIDFYQGDLFTLAQEPKGEGELGARATGAVAALRDHLRFLEDEVLSRSTEAWRMGGEKFARKREGERDSGSDAAEGLREGEAEASRVEREMAVIARQLWGTTFPGEPVPPDDVAGRRSLIR